MARPATLAHVVFMTHRFDEMVDAFVVNWHDKVNCNFVTLFIDLAGKLVHSSALLYYGTPNEVTSFDTAVVTSIRR